MQIPLHPNILLQNFPYGLNPIKILRVDYPGKVYRTGVCPPDPLLTYTLHSLTKFSPDFCPFDGNVLQSRLQKR